MVAAAGEAQSLDQHGIKTVMASIESVNDVKHTQYVQRVIMEMYTP